MKEIISSFQRDLEEKERAREAVLSSSRRITILSKQAIMAVHNSHLEEARSKLGQAREAIEELERNLAPHQDLASNSIRVAYQEYAESEIFIWLVEKGVYPHPSELKIQIIPYLLGLADCIGEFRRRALDFLRRGRLNEAKKCLQIMDEAYMELVSLENIHTVAPELRRKCDIARHVIEATLGDVTTETRRLSLEKSIRRLEKRLEESTGEAEARRDT